MKKLLTVLMVVFLCTGCTNIFNTNKYTTYENINYSTFIEKINAKEDFVLLVWQTGCSHCEDFEPRLNEIIKEYGLKIYGLNLSELKSDEYAVIQNKTLSHATPTLVYFEDGKNNSKIIGAQSKENVINFLKKNKIIKEN